MESDNKLLIRIDERQKEMSKKIDSISLNLVNKVDCSDFEDFKKKVAIMWDDRNRVIGWLLACGVIGGTTGALIKQFVSGVLAK